MQSVLFLETIGADLSKQALVREVGDREKRVQDRVIQWMDTDVLPNNAAADLDQPRPLEVDVYQPQPLEADLNLDHRPLEANLDQPQPQPLDEPRPLEARPPVVTSPELNRGLNSSREGSPLTPVPESIANPPQKFRQTLQTLSSVEKGDGVGTNINNGDGAPFQDLLARV